MDKENKINLIGSMILLGFVADAIYHYIMICFANYDFPYTTSLFDPLDRYNDYFNVCTIVQGLNPYLGENMFPSNYLPFANILFYLFSLSRIYVLRYLVILFGVFFAYFNFLFLFSKAHRCSLNNVVLFSFFTYPFLFVTDRGNIEGLVFIFLLLFTYYYYYRKMPFYSLISLSLAIVIKGPPAVFLILLLADRKYKDILFVIVIAIALTFTSLLFHRGGYANNLAFIRSGFNLTDHVAVGGSAIQRGVSMFSLFKIIFITFNIPVDLLTFLQLYQKIGLFLSALVSAYVIFVEKEVWKKLFLLVAIMLLFPYISADYKLIHIFLALYLFVDSKSESRADVWYASMFGLLLIPKHYYFLTYIVSDSNLSDISIAMPLNILILVTMVFMTIISGISMRLSRIKTSSPV